MVFLRRGAPDSCTYPSFLGPSRYDTDVVLASAPLGFVGRGRSRRFVFLVDGDGTILVQT
jgi:hypothetical protein